MVGVVLLTLSAWGGGRVLMGDVTCALNAAEESMAPGTYVIQDRGQALVIKNSDGGKGTVLSVVTRLARRPSSDGNGSNLVFDTVGGQRFLSEVWLSDGDGFLVRGTQENHEHQLVTPKN